MGSFSTPLSGLTSAQQQLQNVSNNLANIDTNGYKTQTLTFGDIYLQTSTTNGSGDPLQTGSGVSVTSTSSNFKEGNLNATNVSSNMAISGNGFFVTQASDGTQDYTRAGDFTTNNAGQLVTAGGELVLGYPAVNGVVNTSAPLQPLQVVGVTCPAVASTTVGVTVNLASGTTAISGGTVTPTSSASGGNTTLSYNFETNGTVNTGTALTISGATAGTPAFVAPTVVAGESLATYAADVKTALATAVAGGNTGLTGISATVSGTQLNITGPTGFTTSSNVLQDSVGTADSSSLTVYDSLGATHNLTISYAKTSTNTWNYTVTIPTADLTAGGTGTTPIGSGTLNFDGNGQLASSSNVAPISIPSLVDGATVPLKLAGPFGTATSPTITQTALENSSSGKTTDGFPSGTVSDFSVKADGTISGSFSGGSTLAMGQVAVASFANNQGLVSVGGNNYQATNASGPAVIGQASTGGRGKVVGGNVEQSNVDIATEFAKLIVAQQAYSANAKSITTFNTLSQATLAMIQ